MVPEQRSLEDFSPEIFSDSSSIRSGSCVLAPARKPTKGEQQIMATLEELAQQFVSFQEMMKELLDKLSSMEAWRGAVDESMGSLMLKMDDSAARLLRLEATTSAPPPPPPPPQGWVGAGPSTLVPCIPSRPAASATDLPNGHGVAHLPRDAGGGVFGPPPHPANGTFCDPNLLGGDGVVSDCDHGVSSSSLPKMKFPKFDGTNPRLWADQCETCFEVYSVIPALKTRFASLNFTGSAAAWLQTMERKGRFQCWEAMSATCGGAGTLRRVAEGAKWEEGSNPFSGPCQSNGLSPAHSKLPSLRSSPLISDVTL